MELQLNDKKALVSGGSQGIGKAIAYALAREGAAIAICSRSVGPLEAAAREISDETGREVVAIPADLTSAQDAEHFVNKAHDALGRIDILVNNAGAAPGGVIETLSEDDWESA